MKKTALLSILILTSILYAHTASAEVVMDGSMGAAGAIDGPDYDIPAEFGRQAGENLFHSFSSFSVETGGSAYFDGPDSVTRIIGRVTGGGISRIDGTLGSYISGADLFLLNPAGMIFGPDAALDLDGSFHAGAADYLRMEDGTRFGAAPEAGEVLSAAPPAAFGFLGRGGDIAVEGHLSAGWAWGITLAGGNIDISGSLTAEEGLIHLASPGPGGESAVLAPGDAAALAGTISEAGSQIGLTGAALAGTIPEAGGQIRLSGGAPAGAIPEAGGRISLSGGALDVSGEAAGSVFIRGGQFYAESAAILAETWGEWDGGAVDIRAGDVALNGSNIFAESYDMGRSADVRIAAAGSIDISGADAFDAAGAIRTGSFGDVEDAGGAGQIHLTARTIRLADGVQLNAAAFGAGPGADITLIGRESVTLEGNDMDGNATRVEAAAEASYSGDAGAIRVETTRLALADGALMDSATFGAGRGGDVTLIATESVTFSGYSGSGQGSGVIARTDGPDEDAGDAGGIVIETGRLNLRDGGWIGNTSDGGGRGGDVTLKVSGVATFSGADADGYASRVYTTALSDAEYARSAGDIRLTAGEVIFTDGAGITASTTGRGAAGGIHIAAENGIRFSGGNPHGENRDGFGSGLYARADSTDANGGDGGSISVSGASLTLEGGAVITSGTRGGGGGGDIQIQIAGNVHIHGDGADAPAAAPAESQIAFAEENGVRPRADHISGISARSEGTLDGAGDAGAITLSALNILLDDGGRITTAASNAGGGWAEIHVAEILRMSGGRITTSVQKGIGNGGDITIEEPDFLIMNHSEIIARAYEGSGGNIKIKVKDQFIPSSDSVVDASSTLGIDGDIRIESPETDISGGLTVLPANYLDATRWMGTPCESRFDEEVSRFIVEGSEGLPPPFDGVLSGGCE